MFAANCAIIYQLVLWYRSTTRANCDFNFSFLWTLFGDRQIFSIWWFRVDFFLKVFLKVFKMNKRFAISLFIAVVGLFGLIVARTSDELRITLPSGSKLVGRALRSHGGRSIKAFLGIPYAKPPVGHLRFKVN